MKLKLDNGITIEVEGDIEVSISQDGKTISLKPSQPPVPVVIRETVTVPANPQPITTPIIWPNTYPWVIPNTAPAWPYSPCNPIITCGDPVTIGTGTGGGITGIRAGDVSSNSYTVRADDPNLQIVYTNGQSNASHNCTVQ